MADKHNLDLCLMSNPDDLHVSHYDLDLTCDLDKRTFVGSVTLHCQLPQKEGLKSQTIGCSCTGMTDSYEKYQGLERLEEKLKPVQHQVGEAHRTTAECTNLDQATAAGASVGLPNELSHIQSYVTEDKMNNTEKLQKIETFNSHPKGDSSNPSGDYDTKAMTDNANDFVLVLDSWKLCISQVCELQSQSTCLFKSLPSKIGGARDTKQYPQVHTKGNCSCVNKHGLIEETCKDCETYRLHFENQDNCVRIWKAGVKCPCNFPRVVEISYSTRPDGPSLKWIADQDGSPCVFTHGHWINNRSLFPSQDVPEALATWRAHIKVPEHTLVLMSGDTDPVVHSAHEGLKVYEYFTNMAMPSSTLALAVGSWRKVDIITSNQHGQIVLSDDSIESPDCGSMLPCRLFTPNVHLDVARNLLLSYIPRCMMAAWSLLGTHPFQRLDILIVPDSFASLAMANPSLMFLSQSVIAQDGQMLVRVAHEMSHSWFGLLIGPKDWHEEWLSEGFATYAEGLIHSQACQKSKEEFLQERVILDYLKFKTLKAEIENTEGDLQTLRNSEETVDVDGVKYVKNGMNPDKGFMQLHYIKGYFLLRKLEENAGAEKFHKFLKIFVSKFHHKLITSQEVIELYFETFPELRLPGEWGVGEDQIHEWLNSPGLPQGLLSAPEIEQHSYALLPLIKASEVIEFNKKIYKLHWQKRRKLDISLRIASCCCFWTSYWRKGRLTPVS